MEPLRYFAPKGDARISSEPQESDVLMAFESRSFFSEYKDYYKAKRQNFYATIQSFPQLWECFQRLDQIWAHEFNDMHVVTDPKHHVPRNALHERTCEVSDSDGQSWFFMLPGRGVGERDPCAAQLSLSHTPTRLLESRTC